MSNGADSSEVDVRRTSLREAVLPASVQKSVLEVLLPFLQPTSDVISTRGLDATDYCIRPNVRKQLSTRQVVKSKSEWYPQLTEQSNHGNVG